MRLAAGAFGAVWPDVDFAADVFDVLFAGAVFAREVFATSDVGESVVFLVEVDLEEGD